MVVFWVIHPLVDSVVPIRAPEKDELFDKFLVRSGQAHVHTSAHAHTHTHTHTHTHKRKEIV